MKAVRYRVHFVESERGWGQDHWHEDYETRQEAETRMRECNERNEPGPAPDYYIVAQNVEVVEVDIPKEEPMSKRETAAERRAREAREQREADERWEAEKPQRLLKALARADELDIPARVFYRHDDVMYYSFRTSPDVQGTWCDTVAELSERIMTNIESDLEQVAAERARARRLAQVKEELIARLTDEEKEALGLD